MPAFDQRQLQRNGPLVLGAVAATAALAGGIYLMRSSRRSLPRTGPYPPSSLPEGAYDAVIVGGGPSGSVAAYYLVKAGAKVVVLDKESFPRDKYCGDAVCTPAIRILEDMGVMEHLVEHNEAQFANSGGFVSPSGLSYIGRQPSACHEHLPSPGHASVQTDSWLRAQVRPRRSWGRLHAVLSRGYTWTPG